jgi:hypothetical protein
MDLEAIAPILEDIIRQSLYLKEYKFGVKVPPQKGGKDNKVASGNLARSVQVVTKQSQDVTVLQVLMAEYGQWVQSGRLRGKGFVPVGSLIKWIKQRGLKGRDKKGRFMTDKSFAYAIQKNINKFGIRPANFLDISMEKVMNDPRITELLGDAAYEDLINTIEGI